MSMLWSLAPCKTKSLQQSLVLPSRVKLNLAIPSKNKNQKKWTKINFPVCCSDSTSSISSSSLTNSTAVIPITTTTTITTPVIRKRKRYRKEYPGESKGITEEMRFIATRLRNLKGKKYPPSNNTNGDSKDFHDSSGDGIEEKSKQDSRLSLDSEGETWKPSMEGFVKYLVDSKLVFNTVERIVDVSNDVAYAYFRKTGLERSESISKDLEWFTEQGIAMPEPSTPGVLYVKYLEELAETSAPLFISHFYNIYFSHIAGGQVIARQVSEKILEGRELEIYRWEGDAQELLKSVREKLNILGEHWTRDEKNKCLKEAAKSYKFLGQIVRLIIL